MLDEYTPLLNRFNEFNRNNPKIYELFQRFTLEAINKGHTKLSAWLIANRIRWETMIVTTGEDYKISNDFIALYSRKFMKDYPQYDGFFNIKEMKRL